HAPFEEDWCLYLTLPNEDTLDVSLDHTGDPFDVGIEIGREYYMAEMERDLLKQVLVSFLAGDERWRDLADWRKPTPPDPKVVKAAMNKQKWKLLLLLIPATIALLVMFGKGMWALALVFIGLPIAFTALILLKLREVKRASTWTKGTARILRSEIRREKRTDSDTNSTQTFEHALVEYEFTVKFEKFRGKRISIGEVLPNTPAVQEALKKYPKGGSAPVYYDPANPNDAVLERDLPEKFGLIWIMVAITYAAGFAGAWYVLTR
ncbi:MAG: DUF3592 domain-containing protein, partial [Usitatibacter sp.]